MVDGGDVGLGRARAKDTAAILGRSRARGLYQEPRKVDIGAE